MIAIGRLGCFYDEALFLDHTNLLAQLSYNDYVDKKIRSNIVNVGYDLAKQIKLPKTDADIFDYLGYSLMKICKSIGTSSMMFESTAASR